jgi:Transposase DDE domain
MSRHPALYQWQAVVGKRLPHLSKPMVVGLALWSLGMIIARSCSLTAVAWTLAPILKLKFFTVRERLRDLYREGVAKAGVNRRTLDLSTCWVPWLRWVIDDWSQQQLAVALDATSLGQRFVVLTISVLYRGSAVPVAWKILHATEKHPWIPEWQTLLRQFQQVVPAGWQVIALADRGLYSKELYQAIQGVDWHPLLRINRQGYFRPAGWYHWRRLDKLIQRPSQRWQGRVTVFKNAPGQLGCTLLAGWEEGHGEPWLVLTDLPPQAADVCWYGLRAWIEHGFKETKSGGWQWQHTRMTDPERAERLWLAIALATWWLLSVGGEADNAVAPETLGDVPQTKRRRGPQWRLVAVFRSGWTLIMAAMINHERLPLGTGHPEPWPTMLLPPSAPQQRRKNLQL